MSTTKATVTLHLVNGSAIERRCDRVQMHDATLVGLISDVGVEAFRVPWEGVKILNISPESPGDFSIALRLTRSGQQHEVVGYGSNIRYEEGVFVAQTEAGKAYTTSDVGLSSFQMLWQDRRRVTVKFRH